MKGITLHTMEHEEGIVRGIAQPATNEDDIMRGIVQHTMKPKQCNEDAKYVQPPPQQVKE
jgi:hypothetical protein